MRDCRPALNSVAAGFQRARGLQQWPTPRQRSEAIAQVQ